MSLKSLILSIVLPVLFLSETVVCAIDETESNQFWQDEPRGDSHEIRYGWRLVIVPSPGNIANTLVKRLDEILNLTCTAEYFDDGSGGDRSNVNITSDLKEDQLFKLTWHLPIMPQNSKNRVSFVDSHNSKTLIVDHLKESDAGDYECQAKALSDTENTEGVDSIAPFVEVVTIRVKPKKGSCNDPSFLCSSGECIPKRYLCDGKIDCKDKSDESHETCGTHHPCEGKLKCDDGRCISPHWCCDRTVDKNCSVWVQPPCCRQLKHIQLSLETHYSPQPNHYNDMGFLQTTIYTVIGCAMAFMFIITIMVIAICRVHLKRTAMSHMAHPQMRPHTNQNPFGDILFNSTGGLPYTSAASGLLVTYNINNGVQFMGRPVNPPPYSELVRIPPREGPPPPYTSIENLAIDPSPSSTLNPNPNPQTLSNSNASSTSANLNQNVDRSINSRGDVNLNLNSSSVSATTSSSTGTGRGEVDADVDNDTDDGGVAEPLLQTPTHMSTNSQSGQSQDRSNNDT